MDMVLTGRKKIINNVCIATKISICSKESSTPLNGNTILVKIHTILRNYCDILGPFPVNLGVHITSSASSLVSPSFGPNESCIAGYGHS